MSATPQVPMASSARPSRAGAHAASRSPCMTAAGAGRLGDVTVDVVTGRNHKPGASGDRHRTEVTPFDREGRLASRCAELASAQDIARAASTGGTGPPQPALKRRLQSYGTTRVKGRAHGQA